MPILCRFTLAALIAALGQSAWANPYVEDIESGPGRFSYDESLARPWLEKEAEIPDLPDLADLQRLRVVGLPPELELYLDVDRVTLDPDDEVLRLWVYLRNKRGADNGTYEGYRCTTGEYKVFAYATPRRDRPVTPAKRSTWRQAKAAVATDYRRSLLRYYFCGLRGARPPIEIQRAVREGKPSDPFLYR
jgi:hypothetical protein